jgi:Effector Associated Constant Component 1
MTEVRVHMVGYPDSDAEERADLASTLREEIRERGIDDVAHPSGQAPPGAKGSALEWAQLVITFAGTAPSLVMAVRGWLGRHPNAAIELEIDGDRLVVEQASRADAERAMEAFFARHGGH